jgi:hypothetical protein
MLRGFEILVKIFLNEFSVFAVQVGLSLCRTSYRLLYVRLGSTSELRVNRFLKNPQYRNPEMQQVCQKVD